MSIFDMFRSAQPQQPAQLQQNQQQPNQQQQAMNNQPPQGNPQESQQQQQQEKSPLADFENFWKIDPQKDSQPQSLADFSFNIDPAKIQQTVQGQDFTKAITPELMQKIAAGGTDAVSAMMAAMNTIGQQVMANTLIANSRITEAGIKSTGTKLEATLPGLVRNHTISNALREDNPLFNDPATAPMLAAIEQQMAVKFPTSTPAEVREHAKKYLSGFAQKAAQFSGMELVNPAQKTAQQSQAQGDYDWSSEPI